MESGGKISRVPLIALNSRFSVTSADASRTRAGMDELLTG
jgi:hypothetical protein